MSTFPDPKPGSVFYNNDRVYACLAFAPKAEGHTVVVWKSEVPDINGLSEEEYAHLMAVVFRIRSVLMKAYETDKVYMAYLDEARHVHWHLFPRASGGEMGFSLLNQPSGELTDLSRIPQLQALLAG
ncbi:MAG: HIT family protein [Candidatus Yanofskybacteria bacterium]|nr:HIT family protein [Candidatus Yanofskybacteria bacterium]